MHKLIVLFVVIGLANGERPNFREFYEKSTKALCEVKIEDSDESSFAATRKCLIELLKVRLVARHSPLLTFRYPRNACRSLSPNTSSAWTQLEVSTKRWLKR